MTFINNIQKKKNIFSAKELPLTLMNLDDWSLVVVKGIDCKKYLQTQLTKNVFLLKKNKYTLCGHCNAHGKIWSCLILFVYEETLAYIQRRNVCMKQINEIKKYSIFSKVDFIHHNDSILLGIAGCGTKKFLMKFFTNLPNSDSSIIIENKIVLIYMNDPCERFLLKIPNEHNLLKILLTEKEIYFSSNNQWVSLNIESGIPVIDKDCSGRFFPQDINLDLLNGIDFKKGCYSGQETISKIKFKNIRIRSLYWLVGFSEYIPHNYCTLQIKNGDIWNNIGYVLIAIRIRYNYIWIQSVLNNKKLRKNCIIRFVGDKNSVFFIHKKHCF